MASSLRHRENVRSRGGGDAGVDGAGALPAAASTAKRASTALLLAAYGLGALWFGAAFVAFSLTPDAFTNDHAPRAASMELLPTVAYAVRFLGGMNLGLSLLCVLRLYSAVSWYRRRDKSGRVVGAAAVTAWAHATREWQVLLALAVAHGTQFFFNLPPFARPEVLTWSPSMSFIFVTDFAMSVLSFVAAVLSATCA